MSDHHDRIQAALDAYPQGYTTTAEDLPKGFTVEFEVEKTHFPRIYEVDTYYGRKRYSILVPADCIQDDLCARLLVNANGYVRATSGRPPAVNPPPEGLDWLIRTLEEAKARNLSYDSIFIGRRVRLDLNIYKPTFAYDRPWVSSFPQPECFLALEEVTLL